MTVIAVEWHTRKKENELTPRFYREKVKVLAKEYDWQIKEFDMTTLLTMGAGAFYAVGKGSEQQDAAIFHFTYVPKVAKKPWRL